MVVVEELPATLRISVGRYERRLFLFAHGCKARQEEISESKVSAALNYALGIKPLFFSVTFLISGAT